MLRRCAVFTRQQQHAVLNLSSPEQSTSKCHDDHIHTGKMYGEDKIREGCAVDQEDGVTFTQYMIVVGRRQTWPDVTLTMILSDT